MIIFSKSKKIEALISVYTDAHESISNALDECDIVNDADYETAVFLYHLMLQRFYRDSIIDKLKDEIAFLVSKTCKTEKQAKTMKFRMKIYTEVTHGISRPRGFWYMKEPSEKVYSSAKTCAMISFGDFLIYPESAENYYGCPVPVFDIFDLPLFVSVFTGEVWSMYDAYLKGIGLR